METFHLTGKSLRDYICGASKKCVMIALDVKYPIVFMRNPVFNEAIKQDYVDVVVRKSEVDGRTIYMAGILSAKF